MSRQRYNLRYKPERLDAERRRRLEALPGWTWNPSDSAWEQGYAALKRHVNREGHARVPQAHNEDGFALGSWVATRRRAHAKGTLDPDSAARLEALPGWVWDKPAAEWEQAFAALERFATREGHARVPRRHVEGRVHLGTWVAGQRASYAKGRMQTEAVERLEAVPGWAWDADQSAWDQNYLALEQFAEREGHARVPQDHVESGLALGQWVSSQRQEFKRGNLDPARTRRLTHVPGWTWDARTSVRTAP